MKKFDQDFFDIENFIIKKESFIYSNKNDTRPICHVFYNVNDPFIPIMGASIVSVLENNSNLACTFHILNNDTKREKIANQGGAYVNEYYSFDKSLQKNFRCNR